MNIKIERRADGDVVVYADHPGWSRPASPDESALWAEIARLRAGLELIAKDEHRLMSITARQTAQSILDGKPIT